MTAYRLWHGGADVVLACLGLRFALVGLVWYTTHMGKRRRFTPYQRRANVYFHDQWKMAKKRGIQWSLTFEEWLEWWEVNLGSDWMDKRGRGKDKFCMSRHGDKGAYSLDNIKCVTNSENSSGKVLTGRQVYGVWSGRSMLETPAVIEIYTSTDCARILAKRYNVSYTCIWDIKNHRARLRETKGLQAGVRSCDCGPFGRRCDKLVASRDRQDNPIGGLILSQD